eukprot:524591-Rhodomonas_salina.1
MSVPASHGSTTVCTSVPRSVPASQDSTAIRGTCSGMRHKPERGRHRHNTDRQTDRDIETQGHRDTDTQPARQRHRHRHTRRTLLSSRFERELAGTETLVSAWYKHSHLSTHARVGHADLSTIKGVGHTQSQYQR